MTLKIKLVSYYVKSKINFADLRFIGKTLFSIEMNISNSVGLTMHLKNNCFIDANILTFVHYGFLPSCARFDHNYYPF